MGGETAVERDQTIIDPRKHALTLGKITHIEAELGGSASER